MTRGGPYILIDGPGSNITVGGFYTLSIEVAEKYAQRLDALVTTAAWFKKRFRIDPLKVLRPLNEKPGALSRGPCGERSRLPEETIAKFRKIRAQLLSQGSNMGMSRLCEEAGVNRGTYSWWVHQQEINKLKARSVA